MKERSVGWKTDAILFENTRFNEEPSSQEAIRKALKKLGVPRQKVRIKVLTEGHRGLFGMEGARQAKVRVTIKEEDSQAAGQ